MQDLDDIKAPQRGEPVTPSKGGPFVSNEGDVPIEVTPTRIWGNFWKTQEKKKEEAVKGREIQLPSPADD